MNERLRFIRDFFQINQRDFAKRIGVGASTLAMFETGDRVLKDIHINAICREFNIDEKWLRTGEGEMFDIPESENIQYVEGLLEGEDNPFYDIIMEIMHTYEELSPKSKEALKEFSAKLRSNLEKKKEG